MGKRGPSVPKTINGVGVTQREWRDKILTYVAANAPCGPRDLAQYFGPEWETPERQRLIAANMNHLRKADLLERIQNGKYGLSKNYDLRKNLDLGAMMLNKMVELGGFAYHRELFGAMGYRTSKAEEEEGTRSNQTSQYRVMSKTLKDLERSKKLVHYYGKFWGLPWSEALAQPLTGLWAERLFEAGWPHALDHVAYEKRPNEFNVFPGESTEDLFTEVGLRFKNLRELYNLSAAEMIEVPDVKQAMMDFHHGLNSNGELMNRAYADMEMKVRVVMRDNGWTEIAVKEELLSIEKQNVLAYMLRFFEDGLRLAHTSVPASLYRAYGRYFDFCPANLSRGRLLPMPKAYIA